MISIDSKAFSGCGRLTSVTSFMVTPPILSADIFPSTFKTTGTLYIPAGMRSIYVEKGWSLYFANIVEMEAGEPIWLSIKDASNGFSELKCKTGECYTLRFRPEENWHVHSVTFNGKDVTNELTADNTFTTPVMSKSATIVVNYAQGGTAVKAVSGDTDVRVLKIDDEIVVKNAPASTPIRIYSLNGTLLKTVQSAGNETRISTQNLQDYLLLVNVGKISVKVVR